MINFKAKALLLRCEAYTKYKASKASLRKLEVVSLLKLAKPETYHEVTTNSNGTAAQSKMGWPT